MGAGGPDFDAIAEAVSPEQLACAIGAEKDGSGWRCPHGDLHRNGDEHGSFSIFRDGTRTAAKCHVCGLKGSPVAVVSTVCGISLSEAAERLARDLGLSADGSGGNARPRIVATYDYTDADGELLFQVVRFEPKGFRQRRPNGHGGWIRNLKGVKERPLYRLPNVIEAVAGSKTVHVVEGEKDVEAIEQAGGIATCNPGGAGKWRPEHAEALRGADVVVVADRDEPGREHAQQIADSLRSVAAGVRVVEPAAGSDAFDHLAAGHGLNDFVPMAEANTNSAGPKDESRSRERLADWEERKAVPLSELYADPDATQPRRWDLKPYTAPGRITLLSTAPKLGKTTFAALYAHAKATGGQFLEQLVEPGRVLLVAPDESWRDIVRRHRALGTPGDMIHVWVARALTFSDIARKAAEVGAQLVIVDTLSRVARIPDENDNSAWVAWWGDADPDIRESDAVWMFNHHDRKSGGTHGEGIRGASAIFGSVDVALSLRRVDGEPARRVLRVEGTRFDQAEDLVIELSEEEDTYRTVGELRMVSVLSDDRLMEAHAALEPEPAKVSKIEDRLRARGTEVSRSTLYGYLNRLVAVGLARQEGSGGQLDPARYAVVDSQNPRGSKNLTSSSVGLLETSARQADKSGQPVDAPADTLSERGTSSAGETLSACQDPRGLTTDKLPSPDVLVDATRELDLAPVDPETLGPALSDTESATPRQTERLRQLARDPRWREKRAQVEEIVQRAIERGLTEDSAYVFAGVLGDRLHRTIERRTA